MQDVRGLGRYVTTAFLARLADEGMAVSLVLLALQRTGNAAQGAYTLTAWTAPHLLAAPLTGAVVARARRPRVVYVSALAALGLSICCQALLLGRVPLGLSLGLAVTGGIAGPIVSGGLSSLATGLVAQGPAQARVLALDAASYNGASVAGPAVVTGIAAAFSPALAALALACSAGAAAVLVTLVPVAGFADRGRSGGGRSDRSNAEQQSWRADLAGGVRALRRSRTLAAVTAASCLAYVGSGALSTSAVLLGLHRGYSGGGGLLVTIFACAALVSSIAVARRQVPLAPERLVSVCLCVSAVALGAAGLARPFTACALLFALAGLGNGPLLGALLRVRASYAPPEARAQVFTLCAGLKIFAGSCGAAAAGSASHLPPQLLMAAIATVQIVAAAALAISLPRPSADVPTPRTAAADADQTAGV